VPPGDAVELSVGRFKTVNNLSTTTRSTLAICRHALLLTPPVVPDRTNPRLVARDYFSQGNTLDAIEDLPDFGAPAPADRFLESGLLAGQPIAGENGLPALLVTWRMPAEDPGSPVFNPVVGYRLHRVDRLDPMHYRPTQAGIAPVPECAVRVVPKSVFRATPSTIELRGLTSGDTFSADWKPFATAVPLWTVPPAPAAPSIDFPYGYAFRGLEAGSTDRVDIEPRWLHASLLDVLQELLTLLRLPELGGYEEVSIAYQPRGPMDDKSDPLAAADATIDPQRAARFLGGFGPFASGHTGQDDPYGWNAAEVIGLSCEFVLLDADGERIPIDQLIKERDLLRLLRLRWPATVTPPVSLALFLGEDGQTYLDVLRLMHTAAWPDVRVPDAYFHLGVALKTAVLGRDPASRSAPVFDPAFNANGIPEAVNPWAAGASARILSGLGPGVGGGGAVVYRRATSVASAPPNTLPIDRHGQVEIVLPIPDRLAHSYDLAAELERRYDLAWSRLQPDAPLAADIIPYEVIRPVPVDRTEKLVKHNILATPLAGSIQAYVFAHPAEFAAAASGLNAAHIQYSGQSVVVQRRIPSRARVVGIFAAGFPGIDWNLYSSYAVTLEDDEGRHETPRLHFGPDDETTFALKPIKGTRLAIYGADRYVYPDLPAFYEYRVVAWSTAGRSRSESAATTFVSPLHDMSVYDDNGRILTPARQQPRAVPIRSAAYDAATHAVTLEVLMIHPRNHLREEIAPLWIEDDETVAVDAANSVRYGSLPDLFLTYQVYLRLNFGPEAADEVPTLTPLLTIYPPTAPSRVGATRFQARSQDDDVHLIDDAGNVQELDLTVVQHASGELRFLLELDIADSPSLVDLIDRADAAGELDRLFEISVRRGGAFSEIIAMDSVALVGVSS
jgi:hypothetical protein